MQRYGQQGMGIILGRTLLGFLFASLLAVLGGWAGMIFNLLIGYPWPLELHQHIQMMGIGLGASLGAYLAWMDSTLRWYWILLNVAVIFAGGAAGAYLGRAYGPGVDPSYWWSRFAVDTTIYLTASTSGIIISTTIGLATQIRAGAVRCWSYAMRLGW
jgi:hypothetical protein